MKPAPAAIGGRTRGDSPRGSGRPGGLVLMRNRLLVVAAMAIATSLLASSHAVSNEEPDPDEQAEKQGRDQGETDAPAESDTQAEEHDEARSGTETEPGGQAQAESAIAADPDETPAGNVLHIMG